MTSNQLSVVIAGNRFMRNAQGSPEKQRHQPKTPLERGHAPAATAFLSIN